jgi:hypothetical protein
MTTLKALAFAAVLAFALPVLAHDQRGPNGGRLADAGAYHGELVTKQNTVHFFLLDTKNKPVSVAGYKAVAILAVGGKSQRIVLEPLGDSRLSGTSEQPLGTNAKGVIQLTGPDGKTIQAKY